MVGLLVFVIAFGSANRVMYKIQLVPMQYHSYFLSWFNSTCYTLVYASILLTRTSLGIVTKEMWKFPKWYFLLIGLGDAVGFIFGIMCAVHMSGFLLTLLPQAMIPISMVVNFLLLKARFSVGQIGGAGVLVVGLVISILPALLADTKIDNPFWSFGYFLSIWPNAISFAFKEMVFSKMPKMDIFIVNTFGSIFQLIFSFLLLPVVSIPGLGKVPFNQLPGFVAEASQCFVGITPQSCIDAHADCNCHGEPWATLIYMGINLSWNISLLLLLKNGGAVFTFISVAVSLPIAHLAFALPWPLLPASPLHYLDIIALVIVLFGLVLYRLATILKQQKSKKTKEDVKSPLIISNEKTTTTAAADGANLTETQRLLDGNTPPTPSETETTPNFSNNYQSEGDGNNNNHNNTTTPK